MLRKFLHFNINCFTNENMSYYAVARGRVKGIFQEWHMCDSSVRSFKGARYKKFNSRELAKEFLKENGVNVKQVCNDSDSSSNQSNSPKTNKEFWPDDNSCSSGDEDFLLAASAEVEGSLGTKGQLPKKRKTDVQSSSSTTNNKKLKVDQMIIESVGIKKYGNFQFPIDVDGFVICYTDGSCENNGQKNPVAGFGIYFSENHPMNTSKPVSGRATNNVGEIQASIYAIKIAKDLHINKLCICTDSQFLISSITSWIKFWKKNKWRTKSNQPVKNIEDFKELDELLSQNDINIKWHHVRGHQGILGNEMADRLARKGAQMYRDLHNI